MSDEAQKTCARTNAVLAVHLDGDLWPTDLDRETFGYAFVSDDSLHTHLRECPICQQALQRSRRLDAALASTAGRELAQHSDLDSLGDRWFHNARIAAAELPDEPAEDSFEPSATPATQIVDELPGSSHTATWLAAGLLTAAAAATWICLLTPEHSVERAEPVVAGTVITGPGATVGPLVALAPVIDACEPARTSPVYEPATHQVAATGQRSKGADLPSSLASRMHAGRERIEQLPEQRTWSLADLSGRVAERNLDVPERLAAAERLVRRTRPGSSSARAATDHLLEALASCGDRSDHELLVHEELLDTVRGDASLLVRLEHRLSAIRSDRGYELGRREEAALLVAARVGTSRLDLALRRAVRRHPAVAEVVAASLRCGARIDGAPELLLGCWHDLTALGHHDNAPQWASFWFRGQAATTLDRLPHVLNETRSTKARERCLLAMGVVADDSTLAHLLTRLASPRRAEACAAACALAMLPHRVLEPLTPKARDYEQSLLRAALARAGLPAAQSWIRPLGLSRPQLALVHGASLKRFPEVVAWFRNGYGIGD